MLRVKSKQQIIDDGNEASRLLRDTDFIRFMGEIEQDCWEEFKTTLASDSEAREGIYMKLRGVQAVGQKLRAMQDNAAIEKKSK
jgi:hypothetical protein|tara:strand:+ start:1259 stop:1510 length:252 start_codon:yes stop_codon:yes gene_type:complete